MKNLKKIASVVLALVMAMAMMVPAFATQGDGAETPAAPKAATITINIEDPEDSTVGTDAGEKYTVYKIFDISVSEEKEDQDITDPNGTGSTFELISYTIKKDSPFCDAVRNFKTDAGKTVFKLTDVAGDPDTYVVTREQMKNEEDKNVDIPYDAAKLAKELKGVIDSKDETYNWGGIKVVDEQKSPFQVQNTGYYLIVSSLGSKMVVDTIGQGDMTIKTKNDLPTLDKTIIVPKEDEEAPAAPVAEDGEGDDADPDESNIAKVESTTASYGDTVTFELAVEIPVSAVGEMVVHDTMSEWLTYGDLTDGSYKATVQNGTETGEGVTPCTKEFVISAEQVAAAVKDAVDNNRENTTVYIRYTATLKAGAPTEVTNIANLTYANYKTPDDTVKVYNYKFDLVKTNGDNEVLKGAKFDLYDAETNGNKINLVKDGNDYRVATDEDAVADYVSIEAGSVTIKGLGNGTYWLEETEAPAGYNKLAERKDVTIKDADQEASFETEGEGDEATPTNVYKEGGVHVVNLTGTELPSTGGIGTTIFYVVGGILVVAAVILLVTRKRMSE